MVTTWCWKGSSPLFKTMAFRYKTRLSFSLPIIVVNLRRFVSSKNPRPYLTSENRNDKMLRFTLHVSRLNGIVLSFVNILVFLWSWRCAKKIHVQLTGHITIFEYKSFRNLYFFCALVFHFFVKNNFLLFKGGRLCMKKDTIFENLP